MKIFWQNKIYIWLAGTFFFWFVLAIYFDNIIPNISGVRKSFFYFLKPSYWTGKEGNKVEGIFLYCTNKTYYVCVWKTYASQTCFYTLTEGSICSCNGSVPHVEHITPEDEDVLEEETLVKQQALDRIVDPNIAVQIHGLAKTYPGTSKLGCCKCNKTAPFHAVKVNNVCSLPKLFLVNLR